MAILVAGGSASKVLQIFSHMGLGCVSLNTFFKYQRNQLFPTIYIYWQKYQSTLLSKLKALRDGIVIAGDGRHDSMGHSAKFGAYTIFCCTRFFFLSRPTVHAQIIPAITSAVKMIPGQL
ncbi:uncharacterized protein LOC122948870 [Acropora millepora]|uniref:uncharacterized protein LOC122948870 n=1 Tax=Acropora millepora TaxID=45264 RepID=UPI001CF43BA2|nr:uncharacterized protein LOC122948870 [Acropora millepora]